GSPRPRSGLSRMPRCWFRRAENCPPRRRLSRPASAAPSSPKSHVGSAGARLASRGWSMSHRMRAHRHPIARRQEPSHCSPAGSDFASMRSRLTPKWLRTPRPQGGREPIAAHLKRTIIAAVIALCVTAWSLPAQAQRIDTEHLFGFMIGTDVGELGDKEIEAETVARWGKRPGSYFAAAPALEAEFVPIENLRVSGTVSAAYHDISGVAGLEDRRRGAFDSLSVALRYRLVERTQAGFGLAVDAEPHWGRVDPTSGEPVDRYGADLALLLDKELVPDRVLAAFNLMY